MYDTKVEIEEYFNLNWVSTPVQYQGIDFVNPKKWVSVIFIPIERSSNTCGRVFENSQLKVLVYDVSPTLAIKLMDELNDFLSCLQLNTCNIGVGVPDGMGIIPLDNGVHEIVSLFEVDKN